ncbi:hypothetical protein SCUCBS95973_004961 [Sporothrix curviconia]|uniref:Chloride channel, nucleotide-sensitive, 1A n=1 Tax=Sporothrix curviconia TaxID=1260050 RepID=A0ABP0BTC5_9PEZI
MAPQATASLPTTLRSPPSVDSYTLVAEHQSRTPASFYDGPPVLHYHSTGARAYVSRENRDKLPWGGYETAAEAAGGESWPVMGEGMVEQVVDVFVGSDTLTLYSPAAGCGVALPYPVIGLHAIKSAYTADNRRVPTIYMQLELSGIGEEDEPDTVELTVVPAGAGSAVASGAAADGTAAAPPPQSNSQASNMFDAISTCADLHPDRFGGEDGEDDGGDSYPSFFRQGDENGDDDDEYDEEGDGEDYDGILVEGEDGASLEPIEGFQGVFRGGNTDAGTAAIAALSDLPPPMPGSGGWITAENAHEFFDEDGNWRGRGGSLGEGAGRVRGRDEVEAGLASEAADTSATGVAAESAQAEDGDTGATSAPPNGHDEVNGDGTDNKRIRTE